jgi:hypothetical protein
VTEPDDFFFETGDILHSAALGYYDAENDATYILLERIYAECSREFYGCKHSPQEEVAEKFEKYVIHWLTRIINHEYTHGVLHKICGAKASYDFDNLLPLIMEPSTWDN